MIKWIGIGFLYFLSFGYIGLMKIIDQPIEWFVVGFIFLMAVFLTLLATVLKRHIADTPENRETAKKVIKKAVLGSIMRNE